MAYIAAIRRNSDGLVRHATIHGIDIVDGDVSWWTQGNYSCDCNRHDEFERAGGTTEDELVRQDEVDEVSCGHERYSVLWLELPDGTRLAVDRDERTA